MVNLKTAGIVAGISVTAGLAAIAQRNTMDKPGDFNEKFNVPILAAAGLGAFLFTHHNIGASREKTLAGILAAVAGATLLGNAVGMIPAPS